MRVLKFGGSSIADPDSIRRVVGIVAGRRGDPSVLVFSAVADTTDRLDRIGKLAEGGRLERAVDGVAELRRDHLRLLEGLSLDGRATQQVWRGWQPVFEGLDQLVRAVAALGELSEAVRARLLGCGELLSTRLMAAALVDRGVASRWVDARDCVVTDGRGLEGRPDVAETVRRCRAALAPLVEAGLVPVVPGFIARSREGRDTTLGRGGSDCTAALVGVAMAADEVEIWTDVDGVLTADPRLVPAARPIRELSFREAAELAMFGARVLHPGTVAPALEHGIAVRVRSSRRPERPGTLLVAEPGATDRAVRSITCKGGVAVIQVTAVGDREVHRLLDAMFQIVDRHGVSPGLVATTESSVAVAMAEGAAGSPLLAELERLGAVTVRSGQAMVAVVGDRLLEAPGIVGQVFASLGDVAVSLVSIGGSDLNLALVVAERELPELVRRLHADLVEDHRAGGGLSFEVETAAMKA